MKDSNGRPKNRLPCYRDYQKWNRRNDQETERQLNWRRHFYEEPGLPPALLTLGPGTDDQTLATAAEWAIKGIEPYDADVVWTQVRTRLGEDHPPRPELVALLVRHFAIPDDLRAFVADLIEGKVKRRRGPARQFRPLSSVFSSQLGSAEASYILSEDFNPVPIDDTADAEWNADYEREVRSSLEAAAWAAWAYRVLRWKRVYQRQKQRTGILIDPYREALEKVSSESGVAGDTLDRWLYPR